MLSENMTAILIELERELSQLQQAACPALVGELERLKAIVWSKVIWPPASQPGQQHGNTHDHYLTVGEVVHQFSVTPKWLYRHKKDMPHSQPSRKVLLFPEVAITKWFASRKK